MEAYTPTEVVSRLVDMINGDVPRERAADLLDPSVTIHVDSAIYRGVETWVKWIHLIRNCGRVRELRMIPCLVAPDFQDPCTVNLVVRWRGIRGFDRLPSTTSETYHLRYHVKGNRIDEIWTKKANYVFIFGEWVRFTVLYRLFFGWAILYFATLTHRGIDYRLDRAT